MRVGIWNYYTELTRGGYCLRNANSGIGDNLLQPFVELARVGKERGIEFVGLDEAKIDSLDSVLFVDLPRDEIAGRATASGIPIDLILYECPAILPQNWQVREHSRFRQVYTWNDDLADADIGYRKIQFARQFPRDIPNDGGRRPGFITMIAGNKSSPHPNELYSERVKAIRWYEMNRLGSLGLYGPGWKGFPSWRGVTASKIRALSNYRFSICYENARGFPGYITEKILDCFCAGTVPVYLGAPNVTRWIPKECFIARDDFESLEDLDRYLRRMSKQQLGQYLDAIREFVTGEKSGPFRTETFVETILAGLEK